MFERVKTWVGKLGFEYVRKYDANWWARFIKLAREEDAATGGLRVSDTMRQSAWVNIAITKIAKNIARAEPELYQGDTKLESGPLWELFRYPNPSMSRYELWEATASFYRFRGEYIWIFGDEYKLGVPREIYVLDPAYFKHHLDEKKREITMWTWELPSQQPVPFMPDELIHSHEWNPWDRWRGVNPMTGLGMEVDQAYLATKSNLNMLRNGAIPGGILVSEGPMVSEDEAKAIKERWKKEHGGADRAHEIAVLGYGVKYQQIQMTTADMQYFDLLKWGRSAILAKYGVLPAVAGVKDDQSPLSGEDTKEQMKMFWNMTLIPLLVQFQDDTNRKLLSRIAGKAELRFGLDQIAELQEDEGARFTRYGTAAKDGLLTLNEARERLGIDEEVEWGDTWWRPMGLEDVSAPEPEPAPAPPQFGKPPPVAEEALDGLNEKITKTAYSEIYKTNHWWKMAHGADPVERGYMKALKTWLFDQRARALRIVAANMKDVRDIEAEILEAEYWDDELAKLKKVSNKYFVLAMTAAGQDLLALFQDLGLGVKPDWSIFDTNAVDRLKTRVNQGKLAEITDTLREQLRSTIREGIEGGWPETEMADSIRERYNIASNRAQAIARTELGGVINDSRIEGFQDVGFRRHSWLSARDGSVRTDPFNHAIDGETVEIGERFSNGLRWPNDEQGEAGNVINCRCITLPEEE